MGQFHDDDDSFYISTIQQHQVILLWHFKNDN